MDNAYNGNAFAFMVLHKGIPVAEAYKPDFDQEYKISELVDGKKLHKCPDRDSCPAGED